MTLNPQREDSRRRLREAQRTEAAALENVERAQAARARLQPRIDDAEATVAKAVAQLIAASGLPRAAQLLGEPVNAVRRLKCVGAQARADDDGATDEQGDSPVRTSGEENRS